MMTTGLFHNGSTTAVKWYTTSARHKTDVRLTNCSTIPSPYYHSHWVNSHNVHLTQLVTGHNPPGQNPSFSGKAG